MDPDRRDFAGIPDEAPFLCMGVQLPLVRLDVDKSSVPDDPKVLSLCSLVVKGLVRFKVLQSRVPSPDGQVCRGLYYFSHRKFGRP